MKLRIQFKKTGRVKYIGHLDLLNIFNRAIKAAKAPVSYSKGFNPHMQIAFAAPLSLGIESVCEYVDIGFEEMVDFDKLRTAVNQKFPMGIEITEIYQLAEPCRRVAALVSRAEYQILGMGELSRAQAEAYLAQPEIIAMKKTKRRNEPTDIRPDIFSIVPEEAGVRAVISCGSFQNIKPTLLVQSLFDYLQVERPLYQCKITRTELLGAGESGEILPLSKLETIQSAQG